MQNHNPRTGQVDLFSLFFLAIVLLSALTGLYWGSELGSAHGFWGRLIGGVLGTIAGPMGAMLIAIAITVATEPVDRFWRWWRPYPPACENGTCVRWNDYRRCQIPEGTVRRVRGLACFGERCRCGNLYTGGCDYPLLNRWVRVLPDGDVRPYLRHRVLGRWIRDETNVVVKASESKWSDASLDIPGWLLPVALTVICGGIALTVAYVGPDAKADPIRPWFVIACAALGLGIGCAVWRMHGSGRR